MKEIEFYHVIFVYMNERLEECLSVDDEEDMKEIITYLYGDVQFVSIEKCDKWVQGTSLKPGYHK